MLASEGLNMEVKHTCMNLWSIIVATVSSAMYYTLVCGASTSTDNLPSASNSNHVVALQGDTRLDESRNTRINTGGIDKLVSSWVAYTNDSTFSQRPGFTADGNSRTEPWGESVNVLKRKPSDNILGETLREVNECIVGEKGAHNRSRGGTDLLNRCLKLRVLRNLDEVIRRGSKSFSVLGGWLKFQRMDDSPSQQEDSTARHWDDHEDLVESSGDLDLDYALLTALDKLTRQYSLRVAVYPDMGVRMARSSSEDAVDYSIESLYEDLEEDGLVAGRIQTNKKKKKKQKKKSAKKELAELKKRMLLMMVPMLVQAVILPFALFNMKMMAMKALLAGKLAIVLILINAARSAAVRGPDDKFQEQVAAEHYGYGGAPEPSAWFSRRHYRLPPPLIPLTPSQHVPKTLTKRQ